jgi:hypothetical protein
MNLIQQVAIITGAAIFVLLGSAHLWYTLFTDKLSPSSNPAFEAMQNARINLTRQTTVYKAWIGFNLSHSLGAIFFGTINIVLAVEYPEVVGHAMTLLMLNVIVCVSYLIMAKKYWFRVPFRGIAVATCCFVLAVITKFI